MRLAWQAWLAYVHRASSYQSMALLNALYFGVFGPTVILARLVRANLLDLDTRPKDTYWLERKPSPRTLAELTRQF